MDYMSNLQTLESFSNVLGGVPHNKSELGRSSTPWLRLVVLGISHGSQQGTLFNVSQLLSTPYNNYMDYTSTLETLESFWMALSRCSVHQVGAWAILYPFVMVSSTGSCSR